MQFSIKKNWVITLVGGLFCFYASVQQNMMTAFSGELSIFNANPFLISLFSALFFYSNIIFLLPTGFLLDRYSPKSLMLIGIFLGSFGTFLFSFCDNVALGGIGRVLSGAGMAMGFTSSLKIASILLPKNRMALASSLIVSMGMLGGMFVLAPTSVLIAYLGCKGALLVLSFLGIAIGAAIAAVIELPQKIGALKLGLFHSLMRTLKNFENLRMSLVISLINLPISIFGALFGVVYLKEVHGFFNVEASLITSMLFFGMILGGPFFGWLSDIFQKRKKLMLIGAIAALILMTVLLLTPKLNFAFAFLLFFFIGFSSSSQVLGYPIISENNSPKLTGTALSLASLIIIAVGYGIGLPVVGLLLDLFKEAQNSGVNFYTVASYQKALGIIPLGILSGIILLLLKKNNSSAL